MSFERIFLNESFHENSFEWALPSNATKLIFKKILLDLLLFYSLLIIFVICATFYESRRIFLKRKFSERKMSVDIQHILSNMQTGLQDQAEKVKEATKHRDNFAQNIAKLEAQLNETKVVMDELGKSMNESLLISCFLEKVEEGRNIFKLLGPCLVLQDKEIAMQTIKNRHSHMSSELKK